MGIYFMIITAYFLILFNIFGYYILKNQLLKPYKLK